MGIKTTTNKKCFKKVLTVVFSVTTQNTSVKNDYEQTCYTKMC